LEQSEELLSPAALSKTPADGVVPVFMVSSPPISDSVSQPSYTLAFTPLRESDDVPTPFPPSDLVSLPGGGSTGRFSINLIFPNEELPNQSFMVTPSMTVPVLASAIARLLSVSSFIDLYVFPRWALLDHEGFIVSRFLPGTNTPCPYLEPGSTVRDIVRSRLVRFPSSFTRFSHSSSASVRSFNETAPRLVGFSSSSSGLPFSDPPSAVSSADAVIGLVRPAFPVIPALRLDRQNLLSINSSRPGETPAPALSNLQRGENCDDVDCDDAVGSQVIDVFNSVSSGLERGRQQGRQHSSSQLTSPIGSQISDVTPAIVYRQFAAMNVSSVSGGLSPHELVYGNRTSTKALHSSSSVAGDDTLRSSPEWGQLHGPLIPDPNFAPTQWRRFE
jgi:hypothetical protein